MFKTFAKSTGSFLAGFWEQEVSQVTKITVMSMASVLGVLSIAMLPVSTQAYICPCSPVGSPIPCPRDPACSYVTSSICSGSGPGMFQCSGQNWECGTCPSGT